MLRVYMRCVLFPIHIVQYTMLPSRKRCNVAKCYNLSMCLHRLTACATASSHTSLYIHAAMHENLIDRVIASVLRETIPIFFAHTERLPRRPPQNDGLLAMTYYY